MRTTVSSNHANLLSSAWFTSEIRTMCIACRTRFAPAKFLHRENRENREVCIIPRVYTSHVRARLWTAAPERETLCYAARNLLLSRVRARCTNVARYDHTPTKRMKEVWGRGNGGLRTTGSFRLRKWTVLLLLLLFSPAFWYSSSFFSLLDIRIWLYFFVSYYSVTKENNLTYFLSYDARIRRWTNNLRARYNGTTKRKRLKRRGYFAHAHFAQCSVSLRQSEYHTVPLSPVSRTAILYGLRSFFFHRWRSNFVAPLGGDRLMQERSRISYHGDPSRTHTKKARDSIGRKPEVRVRRRRRRRSTRAATKRSRQEEEAKWTEVYTLCRDSPMRSTCACMQSVTH